MNISSLVTAFLPSSFAMYTTAMAYSYAMKTSSRSNTRRTMAATLLFATGAIVGWPFALALSLPFVYEELFIFSGDTVPPIEKAQWMAKRWIRMATAVLAASLIFVRQITIPSLCEAHSISRFPSSGSIALHTGD